MNKSSLCKVMSGAGATAALVVLTGCGGSSDGTAAAAGAATTAPGAPVIGTVSAGNGNATVSFSAPASTGGAAIASYTASCTASGSLVATGSTSPITVTGLTNGTAYNCSVTATNSVGTGPSSAAVAVTPSASATTASTAAIDCPYSGTYAGTYGAAGAMTATWNWICNSTRRTLAGNGLPNHAVGSFPNAGNPNTIASQVISASMTLTPSKATATTAVGGPGGASVYALNSVKFDPGTAGTCPNTATTTSDCNLANGTGAWHIEALGQTAFNFGVDSNNAHVQPTGEYHYHGMPVALLTNAGASDSNRKMVLVGWAGDGYPVYARYCYGNANDATSALKICTGSYVLDTTPDAGRPPVSLAPLGTFVSDWNYAAGSGDLDDCNGRTGVTPEFPGGIYYYMATDSYPYFSRCLKGNVN